MAEVPGVNFPADDFRAGIRLAMTMGAPNKQSDKATFRFRGTKVYTRDGAPVDADSIRLDHEGNPFDPGVKVTVVEPAPVTLEEVAFEFQTATPDELPVGNFKPTKLILTLLDEEYERVSNAYLVELGVDEYVIGYQEPVQGLFGVDVHTFHCFARQET